MGELLRRLRKDAGLTGKDLALRAGVAQPTISRIETGQLLPVPETVDRLVEALDLVIRWERDDLGWLLRDTRTGVAYRSGTQVVPEQPTDSAYLGRLPRPDGNGTFLAIAGIRTNGSLGVVDLLTSEIATIWGQVGDQRFSTVVSVEYDPDSGEPVRTKLDSPLYRHEDD
ncbi:helix-turn-helix transcriptional regulator [Streptosporangium sp. NPDC006013]|uniref:helix-turn-helix domain-containing protein n=1 Tax=Streptosporangium sp. NPDC006013 TaxID=3155596 RepID=UPI00339FE113